MSIRKWIKRAIEALLIVLIASIPAAIMIIWFISCALGEEVI